MRDAEGRLARQGPGYMQPQMPFVNERGARGLLLQSTHSPSTQSGRMTAMPNQDQMPAPKQSARVSLPAPAVGKPGGRLPDVHTSRWRVSSAWRKLSTSGLARTWPLTLTAHISSQARNTHVIMSTSEPAPRRSYGNASIRGPLVVFCAKAWQEGSLCETEARWGEIGLSHRTIPGGAKEQIRGSERARQQKERREEETR